MLGAILAQCGGVESSNANPGHELRRKVSSGPANARHTLVRMEAAGARLGRRVVPDGS